MENQLTCKQCGKSFECQPGTRKDRQYCSQACFGQSNKKTTIVNCDVCGKSIERAPWHANRPGKVYCSQECRFPPVIIKCDWCGKEKKISPSGYGEHNFCCRSCCSSWQRANGIGPNQYSQVAFVCPTCGNSFTRQPNAIKRSKTQYCSSKCFDEMRRATGVMAGENNPAWRGGFDPYYGPNWKRQSYEARKRDGFKCRRCDICESDLPKKLHVHHIISLRTFDRDFKKANALSNLISLCPSCHKFTEWHPEEIANLIKA